MRGHTPLVIGEIMMVSGAAAAADGAGGGLGWKRDERRLLTAFGFALFGAGLLANGFATPAQRFLALFWPQMLRGLAVMFCILPSTRLALEGWAARGRGRRQRLVQPDAQSGRRHRHRR